MEFNYDSASYKEENSNFMHFLVSSSLTMQFSFNRLLIFENFPDIPANEILELFGRMFFEFCQDSGYDKILQVLGATPRDFLQVNLPRAATIHFLTE